jgi:MFS family permease
MIVGITGMPEISRYRRLLVALSIDNLGEGLFLPLAFYFFTVTTTLPVAGIGLTMTCATLSGLLFTPLGGMATDRWGARRMTVVSNLLTAAGYLAYPVASSYAGIFACVFVVMAADRLYFASWSTLIASIAHVDRVDAWFAVVKAVNAGSTVVGALLSTLLLASGGEGMIGAIAVANACSSVIAALLTASQPLNGHAPAQRNKTASPLVALRDRTFRRLLTAQVLIATAWTVPGGFLPLYLTHVMGLPAWWTTLAMAISFFLLFTCQVRITHAIRRVGRVRAIVSGAACLVVAMACMAAAMFFPGASGAPLVLAGIVVFSVGEMLILPTTYAIVTALAPRAARGVYMSMFQITGIVAFGIGPGMVGWLFEVGPLAVPATVSVLVLAGAGLLGLCRHSLSGSIAHRALGHPEGGAVSVG